LPPWAVFAGALTVMLVTRVAPQEDLLAGFANPGVLSAFVLDVVAEAMDRTGAITLIVHRFLGGGPRRGARSTGPSCRSLRAPRRSSTTPRSSRCWSRGFPPSRVLLPVSFASVLGGTATWLGTSTNLVIVGLASERPGLSLGGVLPHPGAGVVVIALTALTSP
jgi:di/tricarboxylate transporter